MALVNALFQLCRLLTCSSGRKSGSGCSLAMYSRGTPISVVPQASMSLVQRRVQGDAVTECFEKFIPAVIDDEEQLCVAWDIHAADDKTRLRACNPPERQSRDALPERALCSETTDLLSKPDCPPSMYLKVPVMKGQGCMTSSVAQVWVRPKARSNCTQSKQGYSRNTL